MIINDKLRKVYDMVQRGEGAEKKTALKILNQLKSKYKVDDSEFLKEEVKYREFRYKTEDHKSILLQVMCKVLNVGQVWKCTGHNNVPRKYLACECTDVQAVEIEFLYEFYCNLWEVEKDRFYTAFIIKHKLFSESQKTSPSPERSMDLEEELAIVKMVSAIQDKKPYKQITQS